MLISEVIQPTLREPLLTRTFLLPIVRSPYGRTRLGLHTDTMMGLIRGLSMQKIVPDLLLEGRIISEDQRDVLQGLAPMLAVAHRRYVRPYVDDFLKNHDLGSIERISPESFMAETGHIIGWFKSAEILDYLRNLDSVDKLMPHWEGVNQLRLGTNSGSDQDLILVTKFLRARLKESDKAFERESQKILEQNGRVGLRDQLVADLTAVYALKDINQAERLMSELYTKYNRLLAQHTEQ